MLAVVSTPATGASISVDGITSNCQQNSVDELRCDFRSHQLETLTSAAASMEGLTLPPPAAQPYPAIGDISAVLVLMDVSSDMQPLAAIVEQLAGLAKSHHHLGLLTFSGQIGTSVAIGSDPKETARAAADLVSAQQRSSRNRDLQLAIKSLATTPAHRKSIVIVSHGKLTPEAYYSDDVLSAAHTAGINVYALLASSGSNDLPGAAALQRLCNESGGTLLPILSSGTSSSITDISTAVEQFYNHFDAGTQFSIDLRSAARAGIVGARQVTVSLSLPTRTVSFMVPVTLDSSAGNKGENTASSSPLSVPADEPYQEHWLSKVALVIVFGLGAAFLKSMWRTGDGKHVAPPRATSSTPAEQERGGASKAAGAAYLRRADNRDSYHEIKRTPWRIGRGDDNDLVVDHGSVSRNHAEIVRRQDQSLMIRDLNSLNGVFLNSKKTAIAALANGDQIDIGDIRFQFVNDV